MNNCTRNRTPKDQFPKGTIIEWTATGAPQALTFMHSPTMVVLEDPAAPIRFEGSVDGEHFALIRDKDNSVVRVTKAGVYRLPVAVCYLRPVSEKPFIVQTFIQG